MSAPTMAGAILTSDGTAVACLVPMPAACQRRADAVRDLAESHDIRGQANGRDLLILARRIAWDSHAAGEYPRAMMADAVDLSTAYPAMSSVVWHLVAGATILGPGCDCQPPAWHRDALVQLAHIVAGDALRTVAAAAEAVPA